MSPKACVNSSFLLLAAVRFLKLLQQAGPCCLLSAGYQQPLPASKRFEQHTDAPKTAITGSKAWICWSCCAQSFPLFFPTTLPAGGNTQKG